MRMLRRAITTLNFSAMSLVLPLRRMPAVSTKMYSLPFLVTVSSTASRVVPAMGETMARSCPVSALSSSKIAVFVDGCYWHGCESHGTRPRTNAEYWTAKIDRNIARDLFQGELLGCSVGRPGIGRVGDGGRRGSVLSRWRA